MRQPAPPCEFQQVRQEFPGLSAAVPEAGDIKRAILKNYFDLRARIWWMNFISLTLVAFCALVGDPPALIWWLIAGQTVVSIVSHLLLDTPHRNADGSVRAERHVLLVAGVMLIEGGLWGLMMLPFAKTLGSDVASTFVCTILIATICIACTLNALRPLRVSAYFAGFFIALFPQCIVFFDIIGPLPLLSTLGLIPAVFSLAHSVRQQAMQTLMTQLENEKLSEQLAESLRLTSYLAKHDALTGLLNRRAFEEAASEFAGAETEDSKLAIILVDLDHFKSVNDSFGHGVGDEVLKKTAACLSSGIGADGLVGRGDAAVARWGGEEFIILLRSASLLSATDMSERLRLAVIEARAEDWPNELLVTGSFGVAIWDRSEHLHDAINRADQAMYSAKAAGRNRVRAYHEAGCLPLEFLQGEARAHSA